MPEVSSTFLKRLIQSPTLQSFRCYPWSSSQTQSNKGEINELVFSLYYLMVPPISPAAFPDGPELVNISLVLYVPITEGKKEIIFSLAPLESLHPNPLPVHKESESGSRSACLRLLISHGR